MDNKKILRYSMQLSMLKQLLSKKLINETEYQVIQKRLMKDYGIVSNITAWHMLETVMTDDEYDDYIAEMDADGRSLFQVFYDQPLIKLSQDIEQDGELLYALSFVTSCYGLCKKGLKKTMFHQEENYSSKVRGKIEIQKNIRMNTCKGRNDRFYCKYIDFTEDNIENRILKATLIKCKEIIGRRFPATLEVSKRVAYCMNSFRRVKTVRIKTSDFNGADASGLYMYYKGLL